LQANDAAVEWGCTALGGRSEDRTYLCRPDPWDGAASAPSTYDGKG
jgi:hypothetical protein